MSVEVKRVDRVSHREATPKMPSGLQYDGTDTPVLIQLPDLTAAPSMAPAAAGPPAEPPVPQPDSPPETVWQRRKRRIHRSHLPTRLPPGALPSPEARSKVFAAVLLVALLGLGYVFLSRDRPAAEPPELEKWANPSSATAPLVGSEPNAEQLDLWPHDNLPLDAGLASEQPQASTPTPISARSGRATATSRVEPQQSTPELFAPAQSGPASSPEMTQWPAGGQGAGQAADGPSSGWPTESSSPSSHLGPRSTGIQPSTAPVSWPDQYQGTSTLQTSMRGYENRASNPSSAAERGGAQLDSNPNLSRSPRSHERIRTSLH